MQIGRTANGENVAEYVSILDGTATKIAGSIARGLGGVGRARAYYNIRSAPVRQPPFVN